MSHRAFLLKKDEAEAQIDITAGCRDTSPCTPLT